MIKSAIRIFIWGLILILIQGCARVGRPTGGPIDHNPPSFLSSDPSYRSTNFQDDEIIIEFDEYLRLKDPNQQVMISPPVKKKPLVREREKTIRITFNEKLQENTTYTLNFGKAIADLNEGNALPDFEFVFSTGNTVDSLSLTGKIMDAFTNVEDKKAPFYVMLYENSNDSAPYISLPNYFGKANEFGLFAVNNIHPGDYRVVALEDKNNNYLYDKGLERIAFLDSALRINAGNVVLENFIKDTIKIITQPLKPVKGKKDTTELKADTLIAGEKSLHARKVFLYYFLEQNDNLYLDSYKRSAKERFTLLFNRPLYDNIGIKPLNFHADSNWFITESKGGNDSLVYWITDTAIIHMDTLNLELSYLTKDSAGGFVTKIDSISLRNTVLSGRTNRNNNARRARSELKKEISEKARLQSNINSKEVLDINKTIIISTQKPLKNVDPAQIELSLLVDSTYTPQLFEVKPDSQSIYKFGISSVWEEASQYKLIVKPGAVYDVYGFTNDSLEIIFPVRSLDYYGSVLLNFSSTQYPMIIQLLDLKSNVIRSHIARTAGNIVFDYLPPGEYSLKAIYDSNHNNIWDTGDYLQGRQPEKVFLSKISQRLRSNWDLDLSWNITFEGTIGK